MDLSGLENFDECWDLCDFHVNDLTSPISTVHFVGLRDPNASEGPAAEAAVAEAAAKVGADLEGEPTSTALGITRRTNPWCIFFQTGDNSSIMLDMSPGASSMLCGFGGVADIAAAGVALDGLIKVISSAKDRDKLPAVDACLKVISVPVHGDRVTLDDIADLVVACGRQKYRFSARGEGGRHWVATVAGDLEDACYVPAGTADKVRGAAVEYWIEHEECLTGGGSALVEGQFL